MGKNTNKPSLRGESKRKDSSLRGSEATEAIQIKQIQKIRQINDPKANQ